MSYATPDQVRAVLTPDPTAPTGTPAELSDAALAWPIDAAQAQIDAALCARYTVPFEPVPRLVGDLTVAIASYLGALTYRKSVDLTATDPLTLRYQWATGILTQLGSGAMDIPPDVDDPDGPDTAASFAHVVNTVPDGMFALSDFNLTTESSGHVRSTPRYGTW